MNAGASITQGTVRPLAASELYGAPAPGAVMTTGKLKPANVTRMFSVLPE